MIKFKKRYLKGIFIAVAILTLDLYLFFKFEDVGMRRFFWPIIVIAVNIAWLQPWTDFLKESKKQKEIEEQFLEFVRNLVSAVKSGISIPRSILQIAHEDYGALTPYVKKLAGQIEWGIPVHEAFVIFAGDTDNSVIKRSVSIIIEAEKKGGSIGDILESVAGSVVDVKKMKEERRAGTYSQIMQGYIVFFIFIVIILILQLWLFPYLSSLDAGEGEGFEGEGALIGVSRAGGEQINMDRLFLSLALIQGFFCGLMVGKFSEGTLKQGLVHSLILMTAAALIITTARGGI